MAVKSLTWADGVDDVSAINREDNTGLMAGFRGKLESAA